ncbi:hypothetical protein GCM10011614_25150 [Novosphingobium colocasiae]|uniref:Outer membrane beta-barrel protein n=1 Tax=Novosphingobium colocasiae TaxID=1256513 RepID=A0A918UHL9_9SPHN|nr:hypothetical protein GCM10011614_25150 [Novosphingobium colocasiae]
MQASLGIAALGAGTLGGAFTARAQSLSPPVTEPDDVAGNRKLPRYQPIGYDLRGFDILPSVRFGARADDNVFFTPDHREADAQLQVEPRLRITRKTKLSALAVDASLRRSIYARLHDQDTTEYGLRAAFRRGNDQAALAAEAGYRREVIQRGSVENDLTAGPPLLRRVLDGALTGHKRFNRFALDARAGVTWLRYESVDGATSDQRFRDGERYEGQLVASFDISARTSVFAAGAYQRFDYRRSPAIGNRDADDWSGLIGVRYDLSRALIAQVGAGYRTHRFVDPRQRSISGPAISAQLRYYPTRLLTVRGSVEQTVTTSPYDLVSAVTVTTGRAELEYEYRRNVSLLAAGALTFEDYGHATYSARTLSLSAGPVWRINNWLSAQASVSYSQRFAQGRGAPFDPYRQFGGMISLTVAR